jgi:hypothetical protein
MSVRETASADSLRDAATVLAVTTYYQAAHRLAGTIPATRMFDRDSFMLGEQLAEANFYEDFRPRLNALYRAPLNRSNELQEAIRRGRVRPFLRSHYREFPAEALSMREAIGSYTRRMYDAGGQYALDSLGLVGVFRLDEPEIIGSIEEHSRQLTEIDGDMSLIDTTVDELTSQLEAQRNSGRDWVDVLPLISAWILGRTVIRTAAIVQSESVRASRWAMLSAFVGNGIKGVRFYTTGDERVCDQCRPLHGEYFELSGVFRPLNDIPGYARIPVHPLCRCFYDAQTDGWIKPALIWTGFALAGLLGE